MKSVRVIGRSGADTSLVTATADDVLEGRVIVDRYGEELVGTIPVYTADGDTELIRLEVGDTYELPYGYYEPGAVTIINDRATYVNGSATQQEVLEGYTIPIDGIPVVGTIPVRDVPTGDALSLSAGDTILISRGYYNADFTIAAEDLNTQVSGTATAADILEGQTAWANGVKLTGTMPIRTASNHDLKNGQQATFEAGYYNKAFNVTALSLASQTPATATAGEILANRTAWVDGELITGTIPNIQGVTDKTLSPGASTTLVPGYYANEITISAAEAPTLASQTPGTATAADILSGQTAWVNGEQVTGTIDKLNKTYKINEIFGDYTISSPAYYMADSKFKIADTKILFYGDGIDRVYLFNDWAGKNRSEIFAAGCSENNNTTDKFYGNSDIHFKKSIIMGPIDVESYSTVDLYFNGGFVVEYNSTTSATAFRANLYAIGGILLYNGDLNGDITSVSSVSAYDTILKLKSINIIKPAPEYRYTSGMSGSSSNGQWKMEMDVSKFWGLSDKICVFVYLKSLPMVGSTIDAENIFDIMDSIKNNTTLEAFAPVVDLENVILKTSVRYDNNKYKDYSGLTT